MHGSRSPTLYPRSAGFEVVSLYTFLSGAQEKNRLFFLVCHDDFASIAAMNDIALLNRYGDFYSDESVVLGLDIGIEGIGITVRRGKTWLYSKTLLVDLPESKALAKRRQFRASRHARKNRRVRMRRLEALFEKHGLPWVSEDVYSRSDPYKLRYRALKGILASPEALSLCIRSCVAHRGYDYRAMSRVEGDYPWGESNSFADAGKWLASAYIDDVLQDILLQLTPELVKRGKELEDEDIREWEVMVQKRAAISKQKGIPHMLEEYAKKHINERKARGYNYPRAHVEEHLRTILERHKHLIEDYDSFVKALFLSCDTPANKKKAIFHYNRKTPAEAKKHYESKVKECSYCDWLEILPGRKCALREEPMIRRWNVLNFLSNHRFYMKAGKLPASLLPPSEQAVRVLIKAIEEEHKTQEKVSWRASKSAFFAALKPLTIDTKNEWNKRQLEQLKELVAPTVKTRSKRAGMSEEAAIALYEQATGGGACLEPAAVEKWKKDCGFYHFLQSSLTAEGGIYPQVRALIGTLRKPSKGGGFATTGLLQRVFEKELKEVLGGKSTPDYCVIECIKSPALNKEQKSEIEKTQKENKKKKEKRAEKYGRESGLTHAEALRMRLFEEQGGDKDKPAVCPFTGRELGTDPFSDDLELAHLFPDSRGGLYIAENLVLTTRKVNHDMGNRTPKEAAESALLGWLSWAEMKNGMKNFRWGKMKKELFCFGEDESISFPDFNNMTRTAQLARELRRMVAAWMGIETDAEAMRTRIGNVAGVYTAAARKCMLGEDYVKDRCDNNHHRYDAAVMTCIPPGEGLNDARYGGVFSTTSGDKEHNRRFSCIVPKEILPDFAALREMQPSVIKPRSRSKSKPLGDSTFWRIEVDRQTSQRTPLDPSKMRVADIYASLRKAMEYALGKADSKCKVTMEVIPSEKEIEKWQSTYQPALAGDPISSAPLRYRNGTPIKCVRKYSKKRSFEKPIGWSGIHENETFGQMRNLDAANDRLEVWLGWNTKKKRWQYYKRVIPTREVLIALKRMGFPWRGRKNAPAYLIALLDRKKAKDLKSLVCGILPPHSRRVGIIRKGDMFECDFEVNKDYVEILKGKTDFKQDEHLERIKAWGRISALRSDSVIEIICVSLKDRKPKTSGNVEDIAKMLKLPSACEQAAIYNMNPPA